MDLESLKKRMAGIGGSDAAAVLGVPSARNTALEVYRSKVQEPTLEDQKRGAMLWGNLLESAIAEHYSREHKVLLHTPGTYVKPGEPMVATLDRVGVQAPPERGLEIKTTDRSLAHRWGPTGGDRIPEEYWVQVQHYYMVIPTIVRLDVAVLIGGNDYREYEIKRDDTFIRDLQAAEADWWKKHVVPKLPPTPVERDVATLKKLFPGTNGESVDISAAAHWHQVREEAKAQMKKMETVIEVAEAQILFLMGEAAVGRIQGMGRYERKKVERKAYSVDANEYIELRHIRSRGE